MNDPSALVADAVGAEGASLLLPHFQTRQVDDGEALFSIGQPSDRLVMVVDGELAASVDTDQGPLEVSRGGAGSWFGEVGYLDGGPSTASVRAEGAVQVLEMDRAKLAELLASAPEVASTLLAFLSRQLAQRIVNTSSGVREPVDGDARLRDPEPTPGFWSRLFGSIFGSGR